LKGIINENYIISDDMMVTPKDLEGVYSIDKKNNEENQKINIYTFCSKIAIKLADPDCIDFLMNYREAPDEHLQ
jgi:hypothetical protein